jgi:hypothetical protein
MLNLVRRTFLTGLLAAWASAAEAGIIFRRIMGKATQAFIGPPSGSTRVDTAGNVRVDTTLANTRVID